MKRQEREERESYNDAADALWVDPNEKRLGIAQRIWRWLLRMAGDQP